MISLYVLGVWDGHDSGAALIKDNKIVFAANEERFTKRKLEINFPVNSINAALLFAGIKPEDVSAVSFPTTEFTKTMSRVFPWQKEKYYMFRRRKMLRPRFEGLMKYAKYTMTSIGVLPLCETVSKNLVSRELKKMGFKNFRIYSVDHHTSHAATAAFTSGMDRALIVTLDGVGDGLCGSISMLENGKLERKETISVRNSIGIFYEQVTNILGFRELEDEGKVMAMADFSFPFKFEDNKLREFFKVEGTKIVAKYGPLAQYDMLSRIAWSTPKEQFAFMAQQVLENVMELFFKAAVEKYGAENIAMSGGTLSNVKANMKVKDLESIKRWFIFPHMGDGGIALGAAMHTNYLLNSISLYKLDDAYLGPSYPENYTESVLKNTKNISYQIEKDRSRHAAELIADDNYVFWFQGRMEYGPRALGNRSILAKADSESVKDKLNLYVKQREWFQPFAPAMLKEDADKILEGVKSPDKFMTMAFKVKDAKAQIMRSVMHVDMTARPQFVGDENITYRDVLRSIKKKTGYGVMLNTSFNIHGQPIVMTPQDAIDTMKKTKTQYMFIDNYFIENKEI